MRKILSSYFCQSCLVAVLLGGTGCDSLQEPSPAGKRGSYSPLANTVTYPESLHEFLNLTDGRWDWSWTCSAPDSQQTGGTAQLALVGLRAYWTYPGAGRASLPAGADTVRLSLTPADPGRWHSLTITWPVVEPPQLLPLPRLRVDSAYYADLLELLQELTTPRFAQRVVHWPEFPVPIKAGEAVSGEVDLTACLYEAMEIWNQGEPEPLFRWDPRSPWGVRLVHFAGHIRRPALSVAVVRLDGQGNPLRINLLAGDNYDDLCDRPYAVRGMIHELAHTLFLWGHSKDRHHVLWGSAPPIVDEPSQDERRAFRLWNLLPEGLDLWIYDRSTEMNPEGYQGQGPAVQQGQDGEGAVGGQRLDDRGRQRNGIGGPQIVEAPQHHPLQQGELALVADQGHLVGRVDADQVLDGGDRPGQTAQPIHQPVLHRLGPGPDPALGHGRNLVPAQAAPGGHLGQEALVEI